MITCIWQRFDSFLQWFPEIRKHCPSAPCILVGTDIHLRKDPDTLRKLANWKGRVLTPNDGARVALKINAETYLECSSKTMVSCS